jgi:hypothetical protein
MSYQVKKNQGKYIISERDTNVEIQLTCGQKQARAICRKMNLGAGFGPWTPEFFLVSYGG